MKNLYAQDDQPYSFVGIYPPKILAKVSTFKLWT